jgi:alkanesulfonate monooxygenase SsuD/methylene tetrahydromethanopterin reductase-like flavin-dependent oxidoreductase (luciferase family)
LRYGLSFLPDATSDVKLASDYYRDALDLSARADELGFDFIKMTEHYIHAYGGYCPSPVAFLSAVASRTQRIRLLTGGILPVFHHPVQLAAETSMLDAISGGRAEIGFARAYMPYEFDAFGVAMDGSRERFVATIDAVVQLWQGTSVSLDTEYFSIREVTSLPPCTQQPHPPIWVAAVQSRQSFAWIGRRGYRLLITPGIAGYESLEELVGVYRECFTEAHPTGTPLIALSLPVFVQETESDALHYGDIHLARYLRVWANAALAWNTKVSADYPRYTGLGLGLKMDSAAAMRHRLAALVGTPDQIRCGIKILVERLGIDVLLLQIDFGSMPGPLARSSLELFVMKVLKG